MPLAAGGLCAILLVGCTGDAGEHASRTASPPPSPSSTSSSTSSSTPPRPSRAGTWVAATTPSDIEGLQLIATYGGTRGGVTRGVRGVGADATVLVSATEGAGPGPALRGSPGLAWVRHGEQRQITAPTAPWPTQLVASDADGSAAVWRETRSVNLDAEDWRILGLDDGGDAHVVATHTDYYGSDVVPPFNPDPHPLALAGDTVYWSIVDWPTSDRRSPQQHGGRYDDRSTARILSAPLDGGGPITEVAEGAFGPADGGGGRLLYIEDERLRTGEDEGEIRVVELEGGARRVVSTTRATAGHGVRTVCGGDGYTVWALDRGRAADEIRVAVDGEERPRVIRLRTRGGGPEVACGDGFITWGNGSSKGDPGLYLYDLDSRQQHRLGQTRGYGETEAAGDVLAWPGEMKGGTTTWTIARWRPPS